MSDVWIANASPVIVLAKVGLLELLTQLSSELILPDAVVDEILAGAVTDPARQRIESGWGARATPDAVPSELVEWGLGNGESSVIALALERVPATVVLDDAAARACATALGVPMIGTLGVVVRAKERGLIPSAADALRSIHNADFFLDGHLIRTVLQRVGESW